jgi:Tol biopolymer transport system component
MQRKILISLIALVSLVLPAAASAAPSTGAVVFSRVSQHTETKKVEGETPKPGEEPKTETKTVVEGGLFAVRDGRLNQLTEDPTDTEPAFSPDGRTIAFVRGGDVYSVRPDGSGQRRLTSGPELDSAPVVAPNGKVVVFERRSAIGAEADLYTVGATGGGLHQLTSGPGDDHSAAFGEEVSRGIVFVRSSAGPEGGNDDLSWVRLSGAGQRRLTFTRGVDEFAPRWFAGGIVFSRGESTPGPAAYADVYTMLGNGTKVKSQVAGVGSAYVEDVSSDGHTLLFRRDQGLWAKRIGAGKARKLCQLPDNSETNGVFSSDGKKVAAFVAAEERQQLVAIDVASRRQSELAEGFELDSKDSKDGSQIGPVIAWQPVPRGN